MNKKMLVASLAAAVSCSFVIAQTSKPTTVPASGAAKVSLSDDHKLAGKKLIEGGIAYLLSQKEEDGGWSLGKGAAKPAATAMVLKALVQSGMTTKDPVVKKGFDVLLSFRQPNGGIYDPKSGQENYTTAVALMALAAAKDPQFKPAIDDAIKYMRGLQIVPGSQSPDGKTLDGKDPWIGGVSYGEHGRPDLSNVGYWMEAMHEAGVKADDPDMQRALVFVTNTQNRSESNPQPWAKIGVNDGGFVYAPAVKGDPNTGETKAKPMPGEMGLRSYGSMTYTGFKSMLYAAVDRQDGRVQAAIKWIQNYWQLDSNPNMPAAQSKEGLYYYYQVFAKAMQAWGEPVITDAKGAPHNWRQELIDTLKQQVKDNGSWRNEQSRWFETVPLLTTCYSVLALQEALRE